MLTVPRSELREVLSACQRAIESAENAVAVPSLADWSVPRQQAKQAKERLNKLWRLIA